MIRYIQLLETMKGSRMGEIDLGAAAEATVQAYKELAADPAKRLALALDRTCIQFLAYVLAEGKGSLVQSAMDTLALIAQTPDCRPSLANTFGVLEALQALSDSEDEISESLKDQAASLFTCLQFVRHIKKPPANTAKSPTAEKQTSTAEKQTSTTEKQTSTPGQSDSTKAEVSKADTTDSEAKASSVKVDERRGSASTVSSSTPPSKESSMASSPTEETERRVSKDSSSLPRSFLGLNNSKAKLVTLFVKGMVNQDHRRLVEEELVRVRGLISIVFDLNHSRVTCRVKRDLSIEKLGLAVARTELLTAQIVTTGPEGEELVMEEGPSLHPAYYPGQEQCSETQLIIPIGDGESGASEASSPLDDLPDYLPEEESPVKDVNSAMAPTGTFKEAASSLFASAANFLQNSFYW
ncbi:uncharacterized protein LOC143027080 isoform X2 [Oratosquilla oratoria]|uniref:uncharacterized protein LOC143027080 isoform X2 n=1 Tax=Oratosquilla oratoria TaxID=337810 RepID=UPI003F76876A